jgi:transposase
LIDRILGEVKIEPDTFEIPAKFNIDEYLSSAWGAFADMQVDTIKLRFSKRISRAIKETKFHPSQAIEMQGDGSLLMTLKVNNTGDFHAWIMSWGKDVEVLEPESLRNQMQDVVRSLADTYNINEISNRSKADESIEITDKQWSLIAPILPPQPSTGRHRVDDRMIINGIVYVLKNKVSWNNLPRKYGACSTCFTRLKVWKQQGVWTKIWDILSSLVDIAKT